MRRTRASTARPTDRHEVLSSGPIALGAPPALRTRELLVRHREALDHLALGPDHEEPLRVLAEPPHPLPGTVDGPGSLRIVESMRRSPYE